MSPRLPVSEWGSEGGEASWSSAFVVGSEACLAAREDTLRLRDG